MSAVATSRLQLYVDRMSQPSRAILIFCKLNGIDFEEVRVDLAKGQHRSPQFKEINPMGQVPAIVDGKFKLFESHAIMKYLACSFPGIPDHWYPADISRRSRIHSILDWHHSNLRRGAARFVFSSALASAFGLPLNPKAAKEAEVILRSSLSKIESFWLNGKGKFLLGSSQPSIADLSLACEIMQLEVVDDVSRERILGSHMKVIKWIEDVKVAMNPHFEEVHEIVYRVKAKLQRKQSKL